MSELKVNKVTPRSGTTVTIGDSGEHLALAGNIGLGGATPTTSGTGITFPATQSASTDANTLDDYEEGTFTPTIIGSTVAGTASYSIQVGRYTKIGNIVFINIILSYSAGNGTGNLRISGLPFTALTAASDQSLAMSVSNIALTAGHVATNYVLSNSSLVIITSYPSGGGAGANVTYDGAGVINVTGHYET